jgi:phenylacetate-CoA ligase
VPHYQLVVDRRATLARLEIQVEPAPGLVELSGGLAADHPAVVALRHDVAARLRSALGLGVEVTLVPPRTIPRSEGKAVRVIEKTS